MKTNFAVFGRRRDAGWGAACMMHPGGLAIETLNSEDAIIQTNEALQDENVILYEPAITYDDKFLIRVDVFEKEGNDVDLIEVKAKSWSSEEELFNQNGTIKSTWCLTCMM